jgi:hypothetical protein
MFRSTSTGISAMADDDGVVLADPANPTDGKPRRRDYEPQRRHHRPHGGRLIKRRRGTARFHTALLTDTFPRTTFTDADLAASCEACQLPSLRPEAPTPQGVSAVDRGHSGVDNSQFVFRGKIFAIPQFAFDLIGDVNMLTRATVGSGIVRFSTFTTLIAEIISAFDSHSGLVGT